MDLKQQQQLRPPQLQQPLHQIQIKAGSNTKKKELKGKTERNENRERALGMVTHWRGNPNR